MEKRILIRILLVVYILVSLVCAVVLLCGAWGIIPGATLAGWMSGLGTDIAAVAVVSVLGLLMVALSLVLLFAPLEQGSAAAQKIRERDFGSISVSIAAMEEIGRRYFNEVKDVRGLKLAIVPSGKNEGITARVTLSLAPQIVIPDITSKIQEELKSCLETYTGVVVNRVEITVADSALAPS